MKLYELKDEQTGRIKFVGTEKECLEFTKENPKENYIMEEVKEKKQDHE